MPDIYIFIYFSLGVGIAFCFDLIYSSMDMEPATWRERLLWIIAWPFFVMIFIYGLFKDDEKDE